MKEYKKPATAELKKRLWFTLGALIVFRFLSFVPLPGIDPTALAAWSQKSAGGILDIFPTTAEHALRLEFFGDELEDIREFSVADQRSIHNPDGTIANIKSVEISPEGIYKVGRLTDAIEHYYLELRNRGEGYAVSIVKAGAQLVGHGAGPVRAPLTDLKPAEMEQLQRLITALGPQ